MLGVIGWSFIRVTRIAMSEIFISYASEDRATAQSLAQALEAQGWTVWWDRKISPGRSFDEVISEALDGAKCVIVLWSKFSVESDWVKEEAAEGVRRKILVPALIDDVPIPIGFRRVHAAKLVGWQGFSEHPELHELQQSVARLLGSRAREPKEPGAASTQRQPSETMPSHGVAIAGLAVRRSTRRWIATTATLLGVLAAGWLAGAFTDAFMSGIEPFLVAIPTWLIGLWLTIVVWQRLR